MNVCDCCKKCYTLQMAFNNIIREYLYVLIHDYLKLEGGRGCCYKTNTPNPLMDSSQDTQYNMYMSFHLECL